MNPINRKQYKMLKRIRKAGSLKRDDLADSEKEICNYLMQSSFIKKVGDKSHSIEEAYNSRKLPEDIELSQSGEAAMFDFRSKFYKWWIPVVISIVSVLLSSASIVSQLVQLLARLLPQ